MCIIWVGKIACCILFVLTGIFVIISSLCPWRIVYSFPANDIDGWNKETNSTKHLIAHFTLYGAVNVVNQTAYDQLFYKTTPFVWKNEEENVWTTLPQGVEFCMDTAVFILYICVFLIYVFNLIWTLVSFCACCCNECFLNILPITTFLATTFLIAGIITFSLKYNVMNSNRIGVWNIAEYSSPCQTAPPPILDDHSEYDADFANFTNTAVAETTEISTMMTVTESSLFLETTAVSDYGNLNMVMTFLSDNNDNISSHSSIVKRSNLPIALSGCDKISADYKQLHCEALTQKTEYSVGPYLGIVAILLSLGSFILSLFVSFLSKYCC